MLFEGEVCWTYVAVYTLICGFLQTLTDKGGATRQILISKPLSPTLPRAVSKKDELVQLNTYQSNAYKSANSDPGI